MRRLNCGVLYKKQPRATEMDLFPIVVSNGVRNTPHDESADMQLIACLRTKGTLELQQYCFKNLIG